MRNFKNCFIAQLLKVRKLRYIPIQINLKGSLVLGWVLQFWLQLALSRICGSQNLSMRKMELVLLKENVVNFCIFFLM